MLERLKEKYVLIPVCPEVLGGLSTPRKPCEICGSRVMTKDGKDCTCEYNAGAEAALDIANKNNVEFCILKSKSPSCGNVYVYDGSFSGTLKKGSGITAQLLFKHGYKVYNENQINDVLNRKTEE